MHNVEKDSTDYVIIIYIYIYDLILYGNVEKNLTFSIISKRDRIR